MHIWKIVHRHVDLDAMRKRASGFYEHEKHMGFKNWRKAAEYGIRELKKTGARLERFEAPADGKTAFYDCVMPIGWDCDLARIEILDNNKENPRLIVDTSIRPLCIAPFSPPTPRQGIIAEVVRERSYGRTSWRNKFILSFNKPSRAPLRRRINETGALGVLCAWNHMPAKAPDSHQFLNSFTDSPGWYPPADEPPAILFSLSPRQGKQLADSIAGHRTFVRVTVHGRLGKDTFLTVSGAIPGRQPGMPEVLAAAHMYEPFYTDDCSGAAGAVEILAAVQRAIRKGDLPRPKRTIRALLMWEKYGLMHFFSMCRKKGRKLLTLINMDGAGQGCREAPLEFIHSSAPLPWGGDFPFLELAHRVMNKRFSGRYRHKDIRGHYVDDCMLTHPAYGVPSLWLHNPPGRYHHSTKLTRGMLNPSLYRAVVSISAAYLYAVASAGENEGREWADGIFKKAQRIKRRLKDKRIGIERAEFEADYLAGCVESLIRLEKTPKKPYKQYMADISSAIRCLVPKRRKGTALPPTMKRASGLIVKLADPGCLPWDLARIPLDKRRQPIAPAREILNWCDGHRDLAEAMRLYCLETDRTFSAEKIQQIMHTLRFLAKAGYVSISSKRSGNG